MNLLQISQAFKPEPDTDYEQGKYVGDTKMTQLSIGFQAGAEGFSEMIFFQDKRAFDEFKSLFARKIIEDEMLWRELEDRYGEYFEGGMGAEATLYLTERGVQVVGTDAWSWDAPFSHTAPFADLPIFLPSEVVSKGEVRP